MPKGKKNVVRRRGQAAAKSANNNSNSGNNRGSTSNAQAEVFSPVVGASGRVYSAEFVEAEERFKRGLEHEQRAARSHGDPSSGRAMIAEWTKAAELGHTRAAYNLGRAYMMGQVVPQDDRLGLLWTAKAADGGHTYAQVNMGICHEFGKNGLSVDFSEALRYYILAADQGEARAQFSAGNLLRDSPDGVQKNPAECARWYRLAIAQDHHLAMLNLGSFAVTLKDEERLDEWQELGVDDDEAVLLLERAAAGGVTRAKTQLGTLYSRGAFGLSQDFAKAVQLYEQAAESNDDGSGSALLHLGDLFAAGSEPTPKLREDLDRCGFPRDLSKAKQYYRRAAKIDEELLVGSVNDAAQEILQHIRGTCVVCQTRGGGHKVCSRCRGPRYCSPTCQKADWSTHKLVCRPKQ